MINLRNNIIMYADHRKAKCSIYQLDYTHYYNSIPHSYIIRTRVIQTM